MPKAKNKELDILASGAAHLVKLMRHLPRCKYYALSQRDGEWEFIRDKFDHEFSVAFDAALDEIFGDNYQPGDLGGQSRA